MNSKIDKFLNFLEKNRIFLFIFYLVLTLFFFLPYIFIPLTLDDSVYKIVAKELASGSILYKDIWDHKQPYLYFLYYYNLSGHL